MNEDIEPPICPKCGTPLPNVNRFSCVSCGWPNKSVKPRHQEPERNLMYNLIMILIPLIITYFGIFLALTIVCTFIGNPFAWWDIKILIPFTIVFVICIIPSIILFNIITGFRGTSIILTPGFVLIFVNLYWIIMMMTYPNSTGLPPEIESSFVQGQVAKQFIKMMIGYFILIFIVGMIRFSIRDND